MSKTAARRQPRSIGTVARVGDRIRITRPAFFVRCGYPLDFDAEYRKVLADRRDDIGRFLVSVGVAPGESIRLSRDMEVAVQKVARAIAYATIRQRRFGGRDRRIYTHEFPDLAGVEAAVSGVRFVKTGEWVPGSGGEEPEPNWLANERTHRILETGLYGMLPGWPPFERSLSIEAANVELITDA